MLRSRAEPIQGEAHGLLRREVSQLHPAGMQVCLSSACGQQT